MHAVAKLLLLFLFFLSRVQAQVQAIDSELKMTFPSIYFKHNSTDYAAMPYSIDSCLKYIATHIKDLNSYPIWRDSLEKERLTYIRMQKLRSDLNKYVSSKQIHFQSMGTAQKISRRTIEKNNENEQIQYFLSLNSVLDVSGAIKNQKQIGNQKKKRNGIPRLVWCGWRYGFHWSSKEQKKSNK